MSSSSNADVAQAVAEVAVPTPPLAEKEVVINGISKLRNDAPEAAATNGEEKTAVTTTITTATESKTASKVEEDSNNNKRKLEETSSTADCTNEVNETPSKKKKASSPDKKVIETSSITKPAANTPFGASSSTSLFSSFASAAKSNPFTTTSTSTTPAFSFPSTKPSPFSFFSTTNKASDSGFGAKTPSSFFTPSSNVTAAKVELNSSSTPIASTESAENSKAFSEEAKDIVTGEESETVVLQLRAKLFSMPPSSSAATATISINWKEVGIGPLRILFNPTANHHRIVQRRESTQGGAGTKLILNVKVIPKSCVVTKASLQQNQAEKFIAMRMIQTDGIQSFLFKFKLVSDANSFLEKMKEILGDEDDTSDSEAKEEKAE